MDLDNIRILSWALAQSIILQYYEHVVDRLYDSVEDLNSQLQSQKLHKVCVSSLSGLCTAGRVWSAPDREKNLSPRQVDKESLYRMLVKNNSIHDLITLSGLRNM